jgi:hypothetical protein
VINDESRFGDIVWTGSAMWLGMGEVAAAACVRSTVTTSSLSGLGHPALVVPIIADVDTLDGCAAAGVVVLDQASTRTCCAAACQAIERALRLPAHLRTLLDRSLQHGPAYPQLVPIA